MISICARQRRRLSATRACSARDRPDLGLYPIDPERIDRSVNSFLPEAAHLSLIERLRLDRAMPGRAGVEPRPIANAQRLACAETASDAMTDFVKTAQFFDVDVDQIPSALTLVANHWRLLLKRLEPSKTKPRQPARHGGKLQTELGRDRRAGQATFAPQVHDPGDRGLRQPVGDVVRPEEAFCKDAEPPSR